MTGIRLDAWHLDAARRIAEHQLQLLGTTRTQIHQWAHDHGHLTDIEHPELIDHDEPPISLHLIHRWARRHHRLHLLGHPTFDPLPTDQDHQQDHQQDQTQHDEHAADDDVEDDEDAETVAAIGTSPPFFVATADLPGGTRDGSLSPRRGVDRGGVA